MPRIWEQNENMLIPYYLMFSYLYYEKNISLIEDTEFDQMCKTLLEKITLQGSIPEPLRVSQTLAKTILKTNNSQ